MLYVAQPLFFQVIPLILLHTIFILKLFYDKFKVTIKQELDDNQKKEKDKIAKDKLKKEQDKKKKEEQGDKIQIKPYTGPS